MQNQQPQVNLDLTKTTAVDLPSGGKIWQSGVILRRISKFVTGTSDNFVYGIDAVSGKELWSYKMEASGSAPPILYEVDGRQYLSIISTGGAYNDYKEKGSTIYTFGIN